MKNFLLPAVMLMAVILSSGADARGLGKFFIYQHGQRYVANPISNWVSSDVSNRSFVEFDID